MSLGERFEEALGLGRLERERTLHEEVAKQEHPGWEERQCRVFALQHKAHEEREPDGQDTSQKENHEAEHHRVERKSRLEDRARSIGPDAAFHHRQEAVSVADDAGHVERGPGELPLGTSGGRRRDF
jgi:hypothetical protein